MSLIIISILLMIVIGVLYFANINSIKITQNGVFTNVILIVLSAGFILVDQATKIWAVNTLKTSDIVIWNKVFRLHYLENFGAAYGILNGKKEFLIIFTAIVTIALIIYMIRIKTDNVFDKVSKFAISMIIGGAIGNIIDRMSLGYVRDFLYFELIDFPVFNVADICVVVGVGLLMLMIIIKDIQEEKAKKKQNK